MKQNILPIISLFLMVGCSSGIGNSPSLPGKKVELVGVPGRVSEYTEKIILSDFANDVSRDPEVSILSTGGALLTIWARPARNWLWGYTPNDSRDFKENRNWRLKNGKDIGTFKFINVAQGTCIEAFKNGVIHNICNDNSLAQEFQLIPSTNGNVIIKSSELQTCLRADYLSRTMLSPYAFTITLEKCPKPKEETREMLWTLSAPVRAAKPNLIKPEIRPFRPLPIPSHDKPENMEEL